MLSTQRIKRTQLNLFRLVYVGSLIVFLAGCSSSSSIFSPTVNSKGSPKPSPNLSGNVIVSGFLTVGSYTAYPPQESIDQASNKTVGFDIDLITAIAQHMNLKIKVVNTEFQSLISDLLTNNFDVAISAIIISPELQRKVSFIPYFMGGESLLVSQGNPHKIKSLQNLCGLKVAVLASTLEQKDLAMTSDNCLQEKKPSVRVIVLSDSVAVVQLLLKQQVAAVYLDSPMTDSFIKQYPDRFEVGGAVMNTNLEGIALRKDDAAMFKAIQAAFSAVKADGTYCSLINKWGLINGALTQNNRSIC